MKRKEIVSGNSYTNDRQDHYHTIRRVLRIEHNEAYPVLTQVFYEVVAGHAISGSIGSKGQVSLPQFAKWAVREVTQGVGGKSNDKEAGVKKASMFVPRIAEVLRGAHSKDAQRNYLGFVYKEDVHTFQDAVIDRATACGLTVRRVRKYHQDEWDRLNFKPNPEIAHLFEKNGDPVEVSLLVEKPIIGYDEKGHSIYDYNRLMVFIGFTIRKKNLTFFRNFLLTHILTLEEEAV